jgi:ribosome biogenesis GTPase / thiamine phosphate phosphatase
MKNLEKLGYDRWFKNQVDAEMIAAHEIARVISVHKDRYTITRGLGDVFAELSGHLSYTAEYSIDLPTTGDWVYADFYDDDTHAIIHGVAPRKTLLKRKTAGKLVDYQLIAANIDVAFIIQSIDYNFNLSRLERYLAMVHEGGITPLILLSKCDLVAQHEMDEIRQSILRITPQTKVLAFSNMTGENIQTIKNLLSSGLTYSLLGSSGVGKTTLLNSMLGSDKFETQNVSKKENKGRHTTTRRELILLDNGAMIIDTPGMRELGSLSVDSGIHETFAEILELTQQCKFTNCSHTNEKGCAIRAAINADELSEKRYNNYIKMKNESAFNQMSYSEKRRKDREFGKLIKNTLKSKLK